MFRGTLGNILNSLKILSRLFGHFKIFIGFKLPKCKYLWLVQKSKMASKNMKPFLAEVLAKTKGGEHLWRAFQVHWKKN